MRQSHREVAVGVDLRLEIGDFLLGGGDSIGAGDEAARRLCFARDRDQRLGEPGRVARLLAVLGLPPLLLRRCARRVILDRRLSVGRRLLREELRAEEPRVNDGGGDAERRDLLILSCRPLSGRLVSPGFRGTAPLAP